LPFEQSGRDGTINTAGQTNVHRFHL
jgi:hypothetical protein